MASTAVAVDEPQNVARSLLGQRRPVRPVRLEQSAQAADVDVQGLPRSRGWLIPPEVVDQSLGGDRPAVLEKEPREESLELLARDWPLLAADDHPQRTEDAVLHEWVACRRHASILGRF